jgi:hypothetical protein
MGSSNEQLHSLAEDVKLSAYERHPTVYPFLSSCFLFNFPVLLLCFIFKDKNGTSVQVWGCAMSHASPDSSPILRSALSM